MHQLQCFQMCDWSGSNHVPPVARKESKASWWAVPPDHTQWSKKRALKANSVCYFIKEGNECWGQRQHRSTPEELFSIQNLGLAMLIQFYNLQLNLKSQSLTYNSDPLNPLLLILSYLYLPVFICRLKMAIPCDLTKYSCVRNRSNLPHSYALSSYYKKSSWFIFKNSLNL